MEEIKLDHIDLGLNLAYSYMLPLFNIYVYDREIRVVKIYGACSGLECFVKNYGTICYIPDSCDDETYRCITGLEKRYLVEELIKYYDLSVLNNIFYRFTPIYSPSDSLFVAISIYLSRNTDYYLNTVRWVREIIEKSCYSEAANCKDRFNSYQFKEFLSNVEEIRGATIAGDPLASVNKLIRIRGFGVKSAMAYLLHVNGLTRYAPVDRYYSGFLKRIGLKASIPTKEQCIENMLLCFSCRYRDHCLYWLLQKNLGEFNGLIQSIIYIYGRVSRLDRRVSRLEHVLLSRLHRDFFVKEVNKLIEVLREDLG